MADTLDRRLLSIGHLTGSENALHFSVSSPFVSWTPVISSLAQSAQLTATCCCEAPMIDDSWDVLHFVFPSSPLSGTSSYNLGLSLCALAAVQSLVSQTLNASSFHFGWLQSRNMAGHLVVVKHGTFGGHFSVVLK